MAERTRLTGMARWILAPVIWVSLCHSPAPAQSIEAPAAGVLLVAAEHMLDPRFRHTVVLLVEHDRTGTWGVIINRPTDVAAGDLLSSIEKPGDKPNVYFGGPVHIERLVFLYQDDTDSGSGGSGMAGLPGLHWSDSEQELEKRLARNPEQLRVYAGYAGWAPGQLDFELARGDWKMIRGRRDSVFSRDPERLWQSLIDVLGGIAI